MSLAFYETAITVLLALLAFVAFHAWALRRMNQDLRQQLEEVIQFHNTIMKNIHDRAEEDANWWKKGPPEEEAP